jgi:hypothetical protein
MTRFIEAGPWYSKSDNIEEMLREFSNSSVKCHVYGNDKERELLEIKVNSSKWGFLQTQLGLRAIFDHHMPDALIYFIRDDILMQKQLLSEEQLKYLKSIT